MKILSICTSCNKRRFIIKKRTFVLPIKKEKVTTKELRCGKCYKEIHAILYPPLTKGSK